MDLLKLNLTEKEQRELDSLRSQINVSRAVLHHRLENDLSQVELAELAGTTQARVSEVEAMKGDPKLSTLGRIALAMGCMIDMVPIAPQAALVTKGDSFFGFDVVFDATDDGTVYASLKSEEPVHVERVAA